MANIAITSASFCKSPELVKLAQLHLASHNLKFADYSQPFTPDSLKKFLQDADGLLVGREVIDAKLLHGLPSLKAIALYGVGFDNIDLQELQKKNVTFYVKAAVNADAVAELTIGLMLATMRNIALVDRQLRQGVWNKSGGVQLTGKTVAVVGCGAVGQRVARLLKAFSCKILLCDIVSKRALAQEVGGVEVSFLESLRLADVLTLHVPLTPDTNNLISESVLNAMRPRSFLINTSRGAVVDTSALKKSLQSGHIAGAGMDVFSSEPLLDDELCQIPHVVLTPHIGGNAKEAVLAMGQSAVDALKSHFA